NGPDAVDALVAIVIFGLPTYLYCRYSRRVAVTTRNEVRRDDPLFALDADGGPVIGASNDPAHLRGAAVLPDTATAAALPAVDGISGLVTANPRSQSKVAVATARPSISRKVEEETFTQFVPEVAGSVARMTQLGEQCVEVFWDKLLAHKDI